MASFKKVEEALADAAGSMKSFRSNWPGDFHRGVWTKPQATQIDILSAALDRLIDAVKELSELNRGTRP